MSSDAPSSRAVPRDLVPSDTNALVHMNYMSYAAMGQTSGTASPSITAGS